MIHFIAAMFMSCSWMNEALWCSQPINSEIYVSVRKSQVESFESQDYRLVPSIEMMELAHTVMKSPWPDTHEGCKMTVAPVEKSGKYKEYYFRGNCVELRDGLKKLKD